MNRFRTLALLVVMVLPRPCLAQDRFLVRVETSDGNHVVGPIRLLKSFQVRTDLGILEVQVEKIKTVRFRDPVDPFGNLTQGIIEMTSGATIEGSVRIPELKMETEVGMLTINPSKLKAVSIQGRAPADAKADSVASRPDAPPAQRPREGEAPSDLPSRSAPKEGKTGEANPKDRGEKAEPPSTERPSRPSPIPRSLLHPGRNTSAQIKAGPLPPVGPPRPIPWRS